MSRRVAIVGYTQTEHTANSPVTRERMYFNMATELYSSLKLTPKDIGTFVLSSNDFLDGRTISEVYLIQRIGAYMKDETKVEADGLYACLYAWMRILSGQYDTAMVMAGSMAGSQLRPLSLHALTMDPIYERQRGLVNFHSGAALQANAYMTKYKMTGDDLAEYAIKSIRNAQANPKAGIRRGAVPGVKDVLNSRRVYDPLREAHIAPFADGGTAIVLASEERARELTDTPVWIDGFGHYQDTYYIGDRDLLAVKSLRNAAARAYTQAGITKPHSQISFAEIQTNYASEEPILAEAMGLFEQGSGAKVIRSGKSRRDGKLPVNPSGGPLGAHPLTATSLVRLVEAVAQLRGEAGAHQVKKARKAVVHGQEGVCAQHNVVAVLSAS